jgi:TonB-linked SusC/RagA family outer membrane protein
MKYLSNPCKNKIRITAFQKGFYLTTLILLCSLIGYGQNAMTVHGIVTNKDSGLPIDGASVMIKGTTKGTITDDQGHYKIIVNNDATLVFSYVGFETLEKPVTGLEQLNVSLVSVSGTMDVVVVAGAIMKKSDLTGAVATISADQIAATPTTDINQAIQGKLPGVYVKSSAQPGSGASIQIRGINSIQYGTSPIFVVDGTIIDGGYNTLNPDDIESVTVLKDASATAIYGSRGANGVVLVTTKSGHRGVGKVSYDSWVAWDSFSKKLDLMNGHDIFDLRVDAYANAYMDKNPDADRQDYINRYLLSDSSIAFGAYELAAYRNGDSYDWLDRVTRTGFKQNHTISFSGGTEKGTYLVSLNYTDQNGLMQKSDYQRYSGRVNLEQNVKSWLKIGTHTTFSKTTENVVDGSVFSAALGANPLLAIDTTDLAYLKWSDIKNQDQYNPLLSLNILNKQYLTRVLSSNYISVTPVKDLVLRSTFSIDNMDQQQYKYVPAHTGQDLRNSYHGSAEHYKSETLNLQWDNTATYDLHKGAHRLNLLGGMSVQKNTSNYNDIQAHGFPNDDFGYKFLNGAYSKDQTVLASDFVTTSLMSFYARADYNYDQKYFATATVRYDGSSKFGPDHKWGTFPSIAVAWDMAKEDFMNDFNWVNQFKIKAGYGIAGNQNIPNYAMYSLYRPTTTNGQFVYVSDGRLGNPDLQWERQKQLNLGVDMSYLNNRLNASFDYFKINNSNLLMNKTLSTVTGFTNTVANVGELTNRGVEFSLDYAILKGTGLNWNVNFSISSSKNKVTALYADVDAIYNKGGYTGVEIQPTGNLFLGQPVNSIYLYKFKKIAQASDMDQIKNVDYGGRTIHPGDIIPEDLDGNNIIDDNDRTVVGTLDPKYYGGFGTTLSYKGWAFNAFFNYSEGGKRISYLYNSLIGSTGMSAASDDLLNRWTPENTNTLIPRVAYGESVYSYGNVDLGVQDASFIRLATCTFSYTFSSKLRPSFLDNLRLYISGTNLLLWTKDKGFDPETGDDYPNSKSIVVGLNLAF